MANLRNGTRIYGNATIDSNIYINGGYAATSTTTGSLQLLGGAGITGNLYVGGNLSIAGNTTFINTQTITTTDTIAAPAINAGTIGNSGATFTGAGATFTTITSSTHIPSSNNAVTLGSATAYWSTVYAVTFTGTSTTAKYADLAEMYHADDYYAPGTVMIFGGDLDVTISTQSHDTAVAGVVSTNPAYLMNDNFEHDNWLPIALTGRVPCMVRGPVTKGTLLVSSNVRGVACALDKSLYEPGCVIGKSMEIILGNSTKKIEIAIGRF